MQTGIGIPDEVMAEYKQLALKRKHRYIIYKPSADGTMIEIEKIGARDETWEDFVGSVDKLAPKWMVYELEWDAADGSKRSKVFLIAFAPDDTPDKQGKFIVPSNKSVLQNKMKTNRDVQINNWDDLKPENFTKYFD